MARRAAQLDLFQSLAQTPGKGVLHLPYTAEFEAACSQSLGRPPSVEEKHELWERLLRMRSGIPAGDASVEESAQLAPSVDPGVIGVSEVREEPAKAGTSVNSAKQGVNFQGEFSSSLFEASSVKSQQPWSAPASGPLPSDLADERDRMLADIAGSRLGTTEQRVAYLLSRFPETRDSDVVAEIPSRNH